jgi:hypothetical protein
MLLTPLQDFIWQHREDDPRQLALSAKKYPAIQIASAAAQIQALQKVRPKIPSWYREGMEFPLALSLEQASSERTAKFKAGLCSGKKMADLTGGLGVDSYFFAQHFESLVYVEQNAELLAAAQHNFARLGVQNVHFENCSAEDFLEKTTESFDLIYLDPARRDERKGKVFQLNDCSPDILEIRDLILKRSSKILLKTAPLLDLRQAANQLGLVSRIWVVASEGDCREVLYLLEADKTPLDQILISAVVLSENEPGTFEFSWAEEQLAEAPLAAPLHFLYEPNPAVLKAGAFRSFAKRFGLAKLHPNTHLYTSTVLAQGVPARSFAIDQVCKYDKKAVQAAVPSGKANITCRNFPDNPDQVRQKLGLADGGEIYLFAASDAENKKVVMVCRKV